MLQCITPRAQAAGSTSEREKRQRTANFSVHSDCNSMETNQSAALRTEYGRMWIGGVVGIVRGNAPTKINTQNIYFSIFHKLFNLV